MMMKLNKVRNKANAINAIYLTNELQFDDILLERLIRFSFDDAIIHRDLAMDFFSDKQLKRCNCANLISNLN